MNELRIIYSNKWIIQNEKMCIIYLYFLFKKMNYSRCNWFLNSARFAMTPLTIDYRCNWIICHSPGTCTQLAPELVATPRAPFTVDNCPPIGMFIFEFKVEVNKRECVNFLRNWFYYFACAEYFMLQFKTIMYINLALTKNYLWRIWICVLHKHVRFLFLFFSFLFVVMYSFSSYFVLVNLNLITLACSLLISSLFSICMYV